MARDLSGASTDFIDWGDQAAFNFGTNDDFTIYVWIKFDAIPASDAQVRFLTKHGDDPLTSYPYSLRLRNDSVGGHRVSLVRFDGTVADFAHFDGIDPVPTGEWIFMACGRDGAQASELFISAIEMDDPGELPDYTRADQATVDPVTNTRPLRTQWRDIELTDGAIGGVILCNAAHPIGIARGVRHGMLPPDRVLHSQLHGFASPEPDISGNKFDGTINGTMAVRAHPHYVDQWITRTEIAPLRFTVTVVAVGQAQELDAALAATPVRTHAVGQPQELDTAFGVGSAKTKAVGLVTELDQAVAASPERTHAVGLASELDTSFAVEAAKLRAVGLAVESDLAQPATPERTHAAGLVTELDSALAVGSAKLMPVGLVLESDTAFAVSSGTLVAVGLATELDSALAVGSSKVKTVGLVLEADSALAASAARTHAVGLATELDSAFGVDGAKTQAVGLALESDLAFAVGAAKLLGVGQPLELDLAQAVRIGRSFGVGLVTELDSAFSISSTVLIANILFPATLTLDDPARTLALQDPRRVLVIFDPDRRLDLES